jgi:hypothetical protein
MAIEMNPSKELAQSMPSLVYMGVVAKGRHTANIDRKVLAAADAEAEYCL